MPATSSESGTIKVSKPNFADPAAAGGTLKIKSPVSVDTGGGAGGTLKIKSPTDGAAPSGTLKLKAASGDQTVKLGEDRKGGTLKLKGASGPSSTSPAVKQTARTRNSAPAESYDDVVGEDPKAQPGIFITLSSLVAIGTIGFTVFKLFDNYTKLFGQQ